jgi:hypothetical protein
MCKVPKVLVVAPDEKLQDLRRALSSLEYDFTTAVDSADVVVVWEPDDPSLSRYPNAKKVAIGGTATIADMTIDPDDVASFKTRVWELFRPQ